MSKVDSFESLKVWTLFIKIVAIIIITFVVFVVISFTTNVHTNHLNYLYIIGIHLAIICVILQSFKQHQISIYKVTGSTSLRGTPWAELIGIKILLIIYSLTSVIAIMYAIGLIDTGFYREMILDAELGDNQIFSISSTIIYVAGFTLVPIAEELFFRGYLLNKWGESKGVLKAVFFSSFLFAILHIDTGFIAHFVSGIFYSLVYLKTRKLIIPIIFHVFNNAIAGSVIFIPDTGSPFADKSIEQSMRELEMVFSIGTVIFVVLTPIVCYVLYHYFRRVSKVTPYQMNSEGS